ncbi:SpoIIE family protein phosphatase [Methylomonas sp. LL1]|uniref:ATP-binding SpoIIE family protein phosphatase n=1 Tax=Methylomonas sp. LL1 TaxID=2785785 RepID=UPI0018C3F54D|nr:SpoIIE family protein phosphatase [Methylomonas sp. LL1]QPK65085.1 SpoIIE family protein phosphatase [Methylomonas sp. LL1]
MINQNPLPQESASIVLVENEHSCQESVQGMLSSAGYHCRLADSVNQILEYTLAGTLDLLVLGTQVCSCDEVKAIRAAMKSYLPVVVICDNIDDALLDRFEGAGIDSYITRPVNGRLLLSKIQSSLKLRRLHLHEVEQREQLQNYQQRMDIEQEVAVRIFDNVLKRHFLETDVVKSVLSPTALFNGDLLLVAKTPDDHLYLLLGDFTGHGLSASVAATPTAEVFYGMTQKGFTLPDIVREINGKLHKMLPANMFLAATAVALYPDSKTLNLITCGLPEHFLVNHADGSCKAIKSKNIPLGIQEDIELEEQNYSVSRHHYLYLLTDGVFDAENGHGECFGSERVIEAISGHPGKGLESLQSRLAEYSQGLSQKDDITIVKIICDVENVPWRDNSAQQAKRTVQALHWKNMMEFGIDTLAVVNPIPIMVNALMEIQGLQQHRQAIFLIVSELFANALDHGLLELDSAIKDTPEGFMRFYQLKEERLQSRRQGLIRFLFAHKPTRRGGQLTIKVVDSGCGFDWRQRRQELDCNSGFCGRGIKLVETLCSRLTFHGSGNRVTAVFDWQTEA